jgi:hypothetical protein
LLSSADKANLVGGAEVVPLPLALRFRVAVNSFLLLQIAVEMFPHAILPLIEGNETWIYAILHLFGLGNACINPFLYGYLNENFRKEYKNIYR